LRPNWRSVSFSTPKGLHHLGEHTNPEQPLWRECAATLCVSFCSDLCCPLLNNLRDGRDAGVSGQMEFVRIANSADIVSLYEQLLNWEQGALSSSDTLAFFRELVDSGLAWRSTGAVRRTAARLLRDGLIQRPLSSSEKQFELAPRGNVNYIASSEMVSQWIKETN
jgi:hypothetical protein